MSIYAIKGLKQKNAGTSFLKDCQEWDYLHISICKRCELTEPVNGKPCVPIISEQTLPKFLQSRRLENAITRNSNTRLKKISGLANSTLSRVNTVSDKIQLNIIEWIMNFGLSLSNQYFCLCFPSW